MSPGGCQIDGIGVQREFRHTPAFHEHGERSCAGRKPSKRKSEGTSALRKVEERLKGQPGEQMKTSRWTTVGKRYPKEADAPERQPRADRASAIARCWNSTRRSIPLTNQAGTKMPSGPVKFRPKSQAFFRVAFHSLITSKNFKASGSCGLTRSRSFKRSVSSSVTSSCSAT